jgi:hypothetical protein
MDTDQGVHDVCLELLAKKEDLAEHADKKRDTGPVRLHRDSRKMKGKKKLGINNFFLTPHGTNFGSG